MPSLRVTVLKYFIHMRRTKQNTPTAIIASDLHLRDSVPICRADDFWEAQWSKIDYIKKLQEQYDCAVLVAGDIFHNWKASPYLLSTAIARLPNMIVIPGQHDLPQHNMDLINKSGLFVLAKAEKVRILFEGETIEIVDGVTIHGFPFGSTPKKTTKEGRNIALWHNLVWQGKKPWPGCTSPNSAAVLRKYKDYDLILTGDNHKPFTETYEGRLLVNPGSLTRQSADQIDHRPRVYLYYADDNRVTPIYLPIERDAVVRDHIDQAEAKEKRFTAFVSRLNEEWTVDISFERNLEEFFRTNQVRTSVKELTYKVIES